MARPKSTKRHKNLYLEQEIIDALERYASANQTTISDIIADFVRTDKRFVINPIITEKQQKQLELGDFEEFLNDLKDAF